MVRGRASWRDKVLNEADEPKKQRAQAPSASAEWHILVRGVTCPAARVVARAGGARAAEMSADSRLRLFCLWLIVFQNSSLILVTSYSRTLVPAYLPSVAVFLSELMKLAVVISLLAAETPGGASEAIRQCVSLVRDTPHETAQFAVPALCYTLQNNLWYHALSNLDPVTAAVTSQLKVFTTAVASVVMLGRRVNTKQWGALTLLMGGMILMQMRGGGDSGGDDSGGGGGADVVPSVPLRSVPQNTWHGALAMLGSTMLSA